MVVASTSTACGKKHGNTKETTQQSMHLIYSTFQHIYDHNDEDDVPAHYWHEKRQKDVPIIS